MRSKVIAAFATAAIILSGSIAYSSAMGHNKKAMPFAERKQMILKRHMIREKILQEKIEIVQEAIDCIKDADTREELLKCLKKEKRQIQNLKEKYHRMIPKRHRP